MPVRRSTRTSSILQKYESLYSSDGELKDITMLQDEINHIHNKTLLALIKHFKYDPIKIFDLLCEVNAQLFKDFLLSKEDSIDMLSAVIESIIFLINQDEYHLKEVMPLLRNDENLSVHSFNVAFYALQLGHLLHLYPDELTKLGHAALLHDVGKKNIGSIINKNERLDENELKLAQKHTQYSLEILKKNKISDSAILDAVDQHHERYDGSGYPKGLREEDIGLFGSIISMCDVFDALTADRPYRTKLSSFEALKLMTTDPIMKHQFDHHHIKKLLALISMH